MYIIWEVYNAAVALWEIDGEVGGGEIEEGVWDDGWGEDGVDSEEIIGDSEEGIIYSKKVIKYSKEIIVDKYKIGVVDK